MVSLRRSAVWIVAVLVVFGTQIVAQDAAVLKELTRLEDLWAAAIVKKDGAAVGKMLSPQFLSMSEDGRVLDRTALIQDVSTDKDTYSTASNSGYQVRVFGNTAIMVGVFSAVTKTAGATETRRWAWTDTWIKQADGQWLCVASQASRLAK